jgi:hypothetical protein
MIETPTRRGRPRGVESHHVMVRMPVDLIAQIDAYAASLQEQISISDVTISRGMAIRELVKRGLQTVQAEPLPPQEPRPAAPMALTPQPPSHLETVEEPEPMAPPRPPMAAPQGPEVPRPASASDEERIGETPRTQSQRGLPREKFLEIVDMAAQYDKLSRGELSQLLYDRGVYRAKAKDGREVPVNRGTLQKWLDQARDAGLL